MRVLRQALQPTLMAEPFIGPQDHIPRLPMKVDNMADGHDGVRRANFAIPARGLGAPSPGVGVARKVVTAAGPRSPHSAVTVPRVISTTLTLDPHWTCGMKRQ